MVEISAQTSDRKTQIPTIGTLVKGEITAIEPVFTEGGSVRFKIRGFDRAHRLTLGKKTRAFGGAPAPTVTDAQIVSQIASENGLIPKVDALTLTYHYVMQYNQSDWDFLWGRARMLGYEVYVDNMTLNFVKAGKARSLTPTSLKWGENLRRFEPRIVASGAVSKVSVKGWDPDQQKEVESSASSYSGNTVASITGAAVPGSKSITMAYMSTGEDFIADANATSSSIASKIAEARMGEHESSFVRASGEADGNPNLIAGSNVTVSQVGLRFSGKYYLTEARHIIRNGEYKVQFQVTGRSPNSIRHLLMGDDSSKANKMTGVMMAIVTNNNDLEGLGRVKVKFPWMSTAKGELESGWARVAMLGAGAERGIYFMPEVNDEVLVAFEQGDINTPVVVGALWSKKNKPPKAPAGQALAGGKVNQRIIKSRSGHSFVLDDTQGAEKISITDKTGKNEITITSTDNTLTIKGDNKLAITIGQGGIAIESQGLVSIKSTSGDIKLEGMNINLKAQTNCTVEGTAGVTIKNAAAQVALSGPTVNINNGALEVT
jgi:uncharacterized protein involved in type VI secretion and phage assembly